MTKPRVHEDYADEPSEIIFDPDSVDWYKSRLVLVVKVLHCFDPDEWPKALLRIERIKDPKKIVSILVAHFPLSDDARTKLSNEHPLRSFRFLAGLLENAVYMEVLAWRVKTLFPELGVLNKPLLATKLADPNTISVPIDSIPELRQAWDSEELREKLTSIFRDSSIRNRVNQFVNTYCYKAVEYVLPMVTERVDNCLSTLFVEAGTAQIKEPLTEMPDGDAMLRAFLMKTRQQTIDVVKNDLTDRFGIKVGAPKGAKKSKVTMSKQKFEAEFTRIIRELSESDEEPTRGRVARRLGLANTKALDRLKKKYGDNRRWSDVVVEATNSK